MKILMVAGDWNKDGGRPSGYMKKFCEAISLEGSIVTLYNGGNFEDLDKAVEDIAWADVVMWFPNIPNDYPKNINIKLLNSHCLLITSKRNNNEYTWKELINRALISKSNLMVVFSHVNMEIIETEFSNVIGATIIDPLGNIYCENEINIARVVKALESRITYLLTMDRAASQYCAPAREIPNRKRFFKIVRKFGEEFHHLIDPADGVVRFLGNSSFRCTKGFPSFKVEDRIYVSKRDINKDDIDKDGFVEVFEGNGLVRYYGKDKPSVDTPIQVALYQYLPQVKYMIHSHVYITGAPFTSEKVPCGALQEIQQILDVIMNKGYWCNFSINLLGHGSIVFARDLGYFKKIKYEARPMPER